MTSRKLCLTSIILTLALFCPGQAPETEKDKIQIAFLLDVSGSMDQLLLKVKGQFWRMANYLKTGRKNNRKPVIEFAIVIYGLDNHDRFAKTLTEFISDLDSVAINLHNIEIGGGTEYCWTAINLALETLNWSVKKDDLKLIIIAGNESFTQEEIDTKEVIRKARKLNVAINTIYCNITEDAIAEEWRKAAEQGKGSYFTLSLNDSLNMEPNFLDKKLSDFNDKFNETYLPFGTGGKNHYNQMLLQDKNSRMAGAPFFRARVVYKVSESFKNPAWDLVDAFTADSTIIYRIGEFKKDIEDTQNSSDLKELIIRKKDTRASYKEAIRLRHEMIKRYVGESKGDEDLDSAVRTIINKEGKKRNFKFKE